MGILEDLWSAISCDSGSSQPAYMRQYKEERKYSLGSADGSPEPTLTQADGIALHGEGSEQRMAVTSLSDHCVYIVNVASGERMATCGSEAKMPEDGPPPLEFPPGQFFRISGAAFSSAGELYAGDEMLCRIQVFDKAGAFLRSIGGPGTEEGQFRGPGGLAFTADGKLVVADTGNGRVQIFREDGTFVRAFGTQGGRDGEFDGPTDVCVAPDGSIAVTDTGNCRVQVFDEEGKFVSSIGGVEGRGRGMFLYPWAVAAGGGGEIIVCDRNRGDLQIFKNKGGELLQIIGEGGDSDLKLGYTDTMERFPHFVAADAGGQIFVTVGCYVKKLA